MVEKYPHLIGFPTVTTVVQFSFEPLKNTIRGLDICDFIFREFHTCYCPEYIAWGEKRETVIFIPAPPHSSEGHIVRKGQWIEYHPDSRKITVTDTDPRPARMKAMWGGCV